jgi:hypothetical protein
MNMILTQRFKKFCNSVLITSGLLGFSGLVPFAYATEASDSSSEPVEQATSSSTSDSSQPTLADGVYLYGESPEPNQIGSAYLVFEVTDHQLVGAFYLPHSSFDCLEGEVQDDRLNFTLVNSYDRTVQAYSLPIQSDNYVASASEPMTAPIQLNGMHNISTISDNDQRILETCKADFQ